MVCPQCGEQTLALFYPKHKSTSKPPKKNAYKCCAECKATKHKVITKFELFFPSDLDKDGREVNNEMH